MFKFLSILLYFLRELIFDSKEEYNIKSSKFNARKFILMTLIMLSIAGNLIVASKIVSLAQKVMVLQEQVNKCK